MTGNTALRLDEVDQPKMTLTSSSCNMRDASRRYSSGSLFGSYTTGSSRRPSTPPAALTSSIARTVPKKCSDSVAAVTPVRENSTPTRQPDSAGSGFAGCCRFVSIVSIQCSPRCASRCVRLDRGALANCYSRTCDDCLLDEPCGGEAACIVQRPADHLHADRRAARAC